jgi:hypothetical protein
MIKYKVFYTISSVLISFSVYVPSPFSLHDYLQSNMDEEVLLAVALISALKKTKKKKDGMG